MSNSRVGLVLLDSPDGTPRQQWIFDDKELIRIGRSKENDVVVADQLVSREHVYLTADGDAWVLTVLTTQGIYCGARKLLSLRLEPQAQAGFLFRLGAKGPFLRLDPHAEGVVEGVVEETTVCHNPEQQPLLHLDVERLRREVDEISDGDCFRKLRDSLKALKPGRDEPTLDA